MASPESRGGRTGKLSRMRGHMGYFFLTPFLGVEETNEFIDGQDADGAG
jgi:hypothetical protein